MQVKGGNMLTVKVSVSLVLKREIAMQIAVYCAVDF